MRRARHTAALAFFDISGYIATMERHHDTAVIAQRLAALGNETRLAIFHLLVRAGEEGLPVGEIGAHLGMAPSTLSHHLSALVDAGLVGQEKRSRSVINTAKFPAMHDVITHLTGECCAGVPSLPASEEAA